MQYCLRCGVIRRNPVIHLCMAIYQLFLKKLENFMRMVIHFLPNSFSIVKKKVMYSSSLTSDNMYPGCWRNSLISFPGLSVIVFNYHGKQYSDYFKCQNLRPVILHKLIVFYHFYITALWYPMFGKIVSSRRNWSFWVVSRIKRYQQELFRIKA